MDLSYIVPPAENAFFLAAKPSLLVDVAMAMSPHISGFSLKKRNVSATKEDVR
jgi:hypothetical protein